MPSFASPVARLEPMTSEFPAELSLGRCKEGRPMMVMDDINRSGDMAVIDHRATDGGPWWLVDENRFWVLHHKKRRAKRLFRIDPQFQDRVVQRLEIW